jgi:hypothetical protein
MAFSSSPPRMKMLEGRALRGRFLSCLLVGLTEFGPPNLHFHKREALWMEMGPTLLCGDLRATLSTAFLDPAGFSRNSRSMGEPRTIVGF